MSVTREDQVRDMATYDGRDPNRFLATAKRWIEDEVGPRDSYRGFVLIDNGSGITSDVVDIFKQQRHKAFEAGIDPGPLLVGGDMIAADNVFLVGPDYTLPLEIGTAVLVPCRDHRRETRKWTVDHAFARLDIRKAA